MDNIFNRENSTLGIMDDLQIAVHTYDGCARGCSGCVVDTHFKNKARFTNILTHDQMKLIHYRTQEYYSWALENLNKKEYGYFGKHKGGYQINHYSYTFRFGNHSELPVEELLAISSIMNAKFKVFSTAPTEDITKFIEVQKLSQGRFFLEIIYDPVADRAEDIRDMIIEMRKNNILGYPEVLITQRLISAFTPKEFVEKAVAPLGDIGTQMQFGRYSPSKTRNFSLKQVVPLDVEVEWLAEVAKLIVENNFDIHPIPIGEYAVTFLEEYQEHKIQDKFGIINELLIQSIEQPFDAQLVLDKTRDIFLSSLYIDHNLDLYVWSESMGQHVLDSNFGFPKLGNIIDKPIHEIISEKNGVLEKMLRKTLTHLMTHKKCGPCSYKSFCASHAIPFFRKFHEDDGKHCYGYIPVIREFQKSKPFLDNMIEGFRALEF